MTTKKVIIDGIEVFRHCIDSHMQCPRCCRRGGQVLSTTNEFRYYCKFCDIRFNIDGETPEDVDRREGQI